ncbi:thioesterase family protein [Nocardia terpenica]|nr:thioesterase family protein [Nocardia terpenica]MBF6103390.1 thioesterase family protein [Nocardia terpenica]MBF6112236.1 thioesterase family protein [Nocardia terpenica]MBF6117611.1 thioesterase family protein [Nocardia terpenica]MBF6153645.1 thioesterase family protein [Nocardia terpenica]
MTDVALDTTQADRDLDAPFSRVCALTELAPDPSGNGRYRGVIDPIWTVGKKLHGGTMVAASAAAATRRLGALAPELAAMFPIAASTDFLGAPDPGEVDYEVRIRKTGRQICLVDVDLVQDGRTLVHSAVTLGHLDDAAPVYAPDSYTDMPAEPPADSIAYAPDNPMGRLVHVAEGASVAIDRGWARFLDGEQGEPRLRVWIRPRAGDEQDPDVSAYFAMMAGDMSPPVPMNLGRFGWAPTVQLTTYLRRRPAPGWLRIIATTHEIGERMFDEDQLVLDSTGAVVAQSRQLALIPLPR